MVVLIRPDFFLSIEPLADGAIERFMSKNGARCPVLPALSSVLGLGAFISSIPLIMVIIVKPIIMVIIIIPSSFLSARVFSRSQKTPPYSTVDTRQRPIESSTHVDGNEITVQREQISHDGEDGPREISNTADR